MNSERSVTSERLLRLDEAGQVLGVSLDQVRRMVRDGELGVIKLSPRVRRIPAGALDRWVQQRSNEGQAGGDGD
jgi:excisionase family DNA binding protein